MTYRTFLAFFVATPSAALGLLAWRRRLLGRPEVGALLAISAVAFCSALPWDGAAIARGYWFFPTDRLLGPHLGLVPIEEASFFVLETLLVGLGLLNLLGRERQ